MIEANGSGGDPKGVLMLTNISESDRALLAKSKQYDDEDEDDSESDLSSSSDEDDSVRVMYVISAATVLV